MLFGAAEAVPYKDLTITRWALEPVLFMGTASKSEKTAEAPSYCDPSERLIESKRKIPAQAPILSGQAARKGGRRLHFHLI